MSVKNKSKKWTKKHDKVLLELFYDDKSYGEIATKLKRTYHSVAQRLHKLRNEGVELKKRTTGRPLKAKKQEKPAAVKAEAKAKAREYYQRPEVKAQKKTKSADHNKSAPKTLKLSEVITDSKSSLTAITRLVLYAEMLEKQNAALKQRLADVEKALRN